MIAVLITSGGERIEAEVDDCLDAGVVAYSYMYGAKMRVFRFERAEWVTRGKQVCVPVFKECKVALIAGRDSRLEQAAGRVAP